MIFHGLHLALPQDTHDVSLYRFVLPERSVELGAPMLAGRKPNTPFRPSILVAVHPEAQDADAHRILAAIHEPARARDPGFRCGDPRESVLHGSPVVWQDCEVSGPDGMRLFQRIWVWGQPGKAPVVVTLTSASDDLEAWSRSLELPPFATPEVLGR